jgi:hypothetical protein
MGVYGLQFIFSFQRKYAIEAKKMVMLFSF